MKITLMVIGKTDSLWLQDGINEYIKSIKRYVSFDMVVIPDIKKAGNMPEELQKNREGEMILQKDGPGKELHLLDERGVLFSSRDFAQYLEKKMLSGIKELVFVIGGPYGFSEKLYSRANSQISLSKMTFSHQMARLLFTEQIYRAFTILRGEPYHHD